MVKGKETSFPIQLQELNISTRIVGPIAITTMDMLFYNDSNRVLSGDLYFPLNEGQTVSRFALEVNGKLRDGVVVEKAKGREVFERMVRRGIDPGLVELTKGNNFKTRIYPIPAKGTKRVVVSYEQELISNRQGLYYQLPLYFNEKVNQFKLDIKVDGAALPSIEKGNLSNFEFKEWQNVYGASFNKKDFIAQQELVIKIPHDHDQISSITEKAKNGDQYFYVSTNPKIFQKEKQKAKSVCVLWDVSNSGKNRDIKKEMDVLSAYISTLPNPKLRLVTFANTIISNTAYDNLEALKVKLNSVNYDGATQLGVIPFDNYNEEELILVSYAVHTFGNSNVMLPSKPIYVLNSSSGADYAIQKYVSNATGGQTINLTSCTLKDAVNQLGEISYQCISMENIEGTIIQLYPQIAQTVTNSFSIAGILKSTTGRIKINYGFGNKVMWTQTVKIDPENSHDGKSLASRLWAEKKLEDMNVYYEKNKEEITALGKAYSIVTKNTSLIVLDNVADYAENEITPPKELLIAYNKMMNDKSLEVKRERADKTTMVRKNWQKRVDWWNKKFAVVTPKKEYQWENTADSTANLNTVNANGGSESDEETVLENFEVVEYASPLISRDQTSSGATITREEITRMPGRSAASVAATVGDVYPQDDGDISLRGSRSLESDTYIDGVLQDSKGGINKSTKKIAINEWKPGNAIFKQLSEEKESTCYNKYLELKAENSDQATFYADAARVLREKGRNKEALRVISNLAELELENHELLKVLANTLMEWKEIDLAVRVYSEILESREEEPQSYRDLGLALYLQKKDQEAIEMLYQVVEKDWDNRFPEIENIVLGEINGIIANAKTSLNTSFMDNQLIDHLPAGLRIVIDWDADNVDIDLWVTDPRKKKCFYSHPKTKIGGLMSKDFTRGYGPEEFLLKKPMKGKYKVEVNYYGSSQQRITGPPTINAKLITNYGMADEKVKDIVLRLKENKEVVYIGELVVE